MTPEEKKNELIEKFSTINDAIKAVEEIIKEKYDFFRLLYWQEVLTLLKKEIE